MRLPENDEYIEGKKIKILVAGCGTGAEASSLAADFPSAEILAVDLSRTSLAYASYMAGKHGLKNISFRHGDILQLGSCLHDKYDFISCGGVLHHMEDPINGWSVLTGLLKDGGLMCIGLYSKTARRFILQAQEFIKKNQYPLDTQGIMRFRREAPDVLEKRIYDGILKTSDYYYLSMCRDLLFHVQEHDFDIPDIAEALKNMGLLFLGFNFTDASSAVMQYRLMFPDNSEADNLSNWHAFEQKNPDTFKAMYQLWCRKTAVAGA